MNAAFRALADQGAKVHINTEEDFRVVDVLKTSLLVSEFPIKEYIPVYRVADQSLAEFALRQMSMRKLSEEYGAEVERDEAFRTFVYSENEKRMEEGCDRVLVFQGSYINGMGHRFLHPPSSALSPA